MRIAVVGTGGVARRHLGVLRQLEDIVVVGHVSVDSARAAAQAAEWGGSAYTRLEDLLDQACPDAVWICVTPDRHGPLELELVARRIPFFVETPLATGMAIPQSIASALAEAGGPITAVGYKFRGLDTLPRVRALLDEHPPRMVLAFWHDALPPPAWWRRAEQSGGQVVEQATHLLDLARCLVGEAHVLGAMAGRWPRAEAPDADVPDVSAALLRYETRDGPIPGVLSATSLLGGHGTIELQLVCEGRVLRLSERWLRVEDGKSVQEFTSTADPFLIEDRAFVIAVRSQDASAVLCSYVDAIESHRLACAVRQAQHRPVANASTGSGTASTGGDLP